MTKVLEIRLRRMNGSFISNEKPAFVKGRHLVDGVVSINEILDLSRVSRRVCLMFKVDFDQAYELVSWYLLDYLMGRFGFDGIWRA